MSVALVTGASRGIGAALAERLGAAGYAVACVARTRHDGDSPLEGSLDRTVAVVEGHGVGAVAIEADLADEHFDAGATVAAAEAALGPISVLVNNAAAAFYDSFATMSSKRADISYRVNVRAPWMLTRAVVGGMVQRGSGAVLNISSATSRRPVGPPYELGQTLGATAYGGSKAWLERMTTGAAAELHGTGVRLNTLAPESAVATPGAESLVDLSASRATIVEPVETMVEAAMALIEDDELTGRVAYSLSLLARLDRPVRHLDGKAFVSGWQPDDLPVNRLSGEC